MNELTPDLQTTEKFKPENDDRSSLGEYMEKIRIDREFLISAVDVWKNNPPIPEYEGILEAEIEDESS